MWKQQMKEDMRDVSLLIQPWVAWSGGGLGQPRVDRGKAFKHLTFTQHLTLNYLLHVWYELAGKIL